MKNKKGLIAGIVILLILISVYIGLKAAGSEDKEKQTEEKEITAFEVKKEDILRVSIENDGTQYTFVKEEETWKYTEDEKIPLNQAVVSNIISGLTSVKAQRKLEDVENPGDYGLAEPKLKVTITDKDNTETVLNFGDDNEAVSGAYMSIGNNEKIYLVNSSVKTDLQFKKNDLAEMEELPQIAVGNIQKVEISSEEGRKTLQEEEAGGLWTLHKEDGSQISVDTSKVNDYMNYFSSLNWMNFISYDVSQLSDYGLDDATKITVSYEEEQGSKDTSEKTEDEEAEEPVMVQKEFILFVGNTDEDGNYYVKTADSSYIYTMAVSTVEGMMNLDSEHLVSSLVTDYSLADMDKITIERNDETYVLARQETEVKKEDLEETITETKYYLNDEEIPYEDISNFYSKVSGLEWQSMTENQSGENAEIVVTFEKEGGVQDTVHYYPYDENFYLVTKTDGSQMLVNKMKVREMIEAFDGMIENWEK